MLKFYYHLRDHNNLKKQKSANKKKNYNIMITVGVLYLKKYYISFVIMKYVNY